MPVKGHRRRKKEEIGELDSLIRRVKPRETVLRLLISHFEFLAFFAANSISGSSFVDDEVMKLWQENFLTFQNHKTW